MKQTEALVADSVFLYFVPESMSPFLILEELWEVTTVKMGVIETALFVQ